MIVWALKRRGTFGKTSHYDFIHKRWYPWFSEGNITSSYGEVINAKKAEGGGDIYCLIIKLFLRIEIK